MENCKSYYKKIVFSDLNVFSFTDSGYCPNTFTDSGYYCPNTFTDSGYYCPNTFTDSGYYCPNNFTDSGYCPNNFTDSGYVRTPSQIQAMYEHLHRFRLLLTEQLHRFRLLSEQVRRFRLVSEHLHRLGLVSEHLHRLGLVSEHLQRFRLVSEHLHRLGLVSENLTCRWTDFTGPALHLLKVQFHCYKAYGTKDVTRIFFKSPHRNMLQTEVLDITDRGAGSEVQGGVLEPPWQLSI
jgi:hypothetical protein